MEHQESRSRARLVASIVLVLLIGASLVGAAYLRSGSTRASTSTSTSTSQTTSTQSQTFNSAVSPAGLQLQVKLNATAASIGSPLTAQVSLVNTLSTNVSLAADYSANPNIANWDNYDTLCGLSSVDDTFGFALFQGNFAAGNFSKAGTPLLLTPPVATSCPNNSYYQPYVQHVEFAPDSYLATLSANASFSGDFKSQTIKMQENATTGSCITTPYFATGTSFENGVTTTFSGTELGWGCGSLAANALAGYWTQPANGTYVGIDDASNSTIIAGLNSVSQNYFRQFSPGLYTIVAEDMWNQTVYAHFQVVSAIGSPVEVVLVTGPIPPYNPGGPVVIVALMNVGDISITSLNATLPSFPGGPSVPYSFVFNVNSSNPLLPGLSIQETRTLIGASIDSTLEYPLTINGTFVNGTQFSFTEHVKVVPPG